MGFIATPLASDWKHEQDAREDVYKSARLVVDVAANRAIPPTANDLQLDKSFNFLSSPYARITITTPEGKTLLNMTSWSMTSPNDSFHRSGTGSVHGRCRGGCWGDLAVSYSDRRNDPNNFAIDHYCSISRNQGGSFQDIRGTPFSWTPSHHMDVFINPDYMRDYDAVSSDNTASRAGFFSSFQIQTNTNPDVYGMRLKP